MTTKISTTNIQDSALTTLLGPKITTIVYPGTETATDTAGGETINLTGNGFQSGCSVLVSGTAASVVTFISSTQISFTAPALSAGTYVIYVINPDGGTAISIPGISYSGTPNWTTTAGSLGTAYEAGSISATLTATGDAPITYVLATGTLPTGSTLNSNGTLSGTAPATASATTYNFTITAKDAQNQTTNRAFSLTINPDVVTWSTPANLTTYNVYKDQVMANVTMSATSAAGGSITYTADTLPSGLSITGANIAGTPTAVASTTTVLTATSTATRTATRTINWVVSIANDTYFKNTTLLLNGETSVTPFISDASTNSFGLTIAGDTKPVLFNPYQGDGYYGAYFDGSSYVTVPSATNAALNFSTGTCIEGWSYIPSISNYGFIVSSVQGTGGFVPWWYVGHDNAGNWRVSPGDGTDNNITSYPMTKNVWNHFALTNDGTRSRLFVNGVLIYTKAVTPQNTDQNFVLSQYGPNNQYLIAGYVSNIRIIKGSANIPVSYVTSSTTIGASIFTTPTTPLTAVTGTSLLIAQSNRFVDKSSNNFTLTVGGSPTISPVIPFTANSSYSTYGSAYFDGTGDYLAINYASGSTIAGDFTWETWAWDTGATTNGTLLGWRSGSSGWSGFIIQRNNSANVTVSINSGTSITQSSGTYLSNSWNHVAVVRSGTTVTLYVNGASVGTATVSGSFNPGTSYWIGSDPYNNVSAVQLQGYISNQRFVNGTAVYTSAFTLPTSPLTAITNTSLLTCQYNGGANNQGIIDNSNFNNIITRNGNTSQGTFSPYSVTGWSNYFNGSTDYLSLPTAAFSSIDGVNTSYTLECWVYPTSYGGAEGSKLIAIDASGQTSGTFFLIAQNGSFGITNAGANNYTPVLSSAGVVQLNTWSHLCLSKSGSTAKLFFNGTLQTTVTITAATMPTFTTTTIGARFSAGVGVQQALTGYISNLRLIVGTALYTDAFTPSTSPLTPLTPLTTATTNILTCQSNRFVDNGSVNHAITVAGTPTIQAFSPFGSKSEATPLSYSVYLPSDGTQVNITYSSSMLVGTGQFTIEAWIYVNATRAVQQTIFSNRTYNNIGTGTYTFYVASTTNLLMFDQVQGPATLATSTTAVTIGVWQHVAVSRDSSNLIRLFINGVLVNTPSASTFNFSSTNNPQIGYNADTSNYVLIGSISNLRFIVGSALYTTNFTTPTSPLTAVSNTVLLTCQSTRLIDNSTNRLTITNSGDVRLRQFNPFGYTAQTNTSYTPSLHGGSAYFDGTGDYLTAAYNSNYNIPASTPFTVEGWAYTTATTEFHFLNRNWSYGGSGPTYAFYLASGTTPNWSIGGSGSATYVMMSPGTAGKLGQWNHYAWTRDVNNVCRIFTNGVEATGSTRTDSQALTSTSGNMFIGVSSNLASNYTNGYLSDLRFVVGTCTYTSNFIPPAQTLTNYSTTYPSSLLLNFTNGGIIDQHSTNVIETVGSTQLSTSVKKYNVASVYLGGSGNYLQLASTTNLDFGTGDFTIECWVYSISIAVNYPTFISSITGWSAGASGHRFNNTGYANKFWFGLNGSGGVNGGDPFMASSSTFSFNTWYHYALTRSGNTWRMFVNGNLENTQTYSGSYNAAYGGMRLGYSTWDGANGWFNGYLDDLRFTKGYARYTANFTAPTSALITK